MFLGETAGEKRASDLYHTRIGNATRLPLRINYCSFNSLVKYAPVRLDFSSLKE